MSLLRSAQKNLGLVVDVISTYGYRGKGANDGGQWFFGNDGIDLHFNYKGNNSCIDAYQKCPPVSAIINKKAQAFINGKTGIFNTQGKPATSNEAKKISALLKNPNPLQSQKQFEAQQYIYMQLFGYCPMLIMKSFGFPNHEADQLWNIPPFMIDIEETKNLWYNNPDKVINKIVLNYKNIKSNLDLSNVYIFEDFTPSFTSVIIPDSRLKALAKPINNIIGAYESRNVLINYRGALGILTPEKDTMGTIPIDPKHKAALQTDFRRYGLQESQWQVIISQAAMKWQPMGYPTKELMLFEEVEASTMAICDAFSYPFRLLNYNGGSLSGTDVKEFKKQLYQDAIIPESDSIYEQYNSLFKTEELNITIKKDFGHIAVMQEDIKLISESRFYLSRSAQMDFLCNVITLNQYRTIMSVPVTTDGNVYYSDIKEMIGTPKVEAGQISEQKEEVPNA